MPAAWAAELQPDEAAAEPVAALLRPPQAAEALAAAVRRRVASDARPRPAAGAADGSLAAAGVADGSLAAAEVAAGSPGAAVPVAAPAACRTAAAPPLAACGWLCPAAAQEDGPADDRRQEAAACWAQQPAQPSSAQSQAVMPAAPPVASDWLCPAAARHPEDGGSLALVDPAPAVRCSVPQCSELCCLAQRRSA
jgi:hypothetical protein